jgi:hypothetical protein
MGDEGGYSIPEHLQKPLRDRLTGGICGSTRRINLGDEGGAGMDKDLARIRQRLDQLGLKLRRMEDDLRQDVLELDRIERGLRWSGATRWTFGLTGIQREDGRMLGDLLEEATGGEVRRIARSAWKEAYQITLEKRDYHVWFLLSGGDEPRGWPQVAELRMLDGPIPLKVFTQFDTAEQTIAWVEQLCSMAEPCWFFDHAQGLRRGDGARFADLLRAAALRTDPDARASQVCRVKEGEQTREDFVVHHRGRTIAVRAQMGGDAPRRLLRVGRLRGPEDIQIFAAEDAWSQVADWLIQVRRGGIQLEDRKPSDAEGRDPTWRMTRDGPLREDGARFIDLLREALRKSDPQATVVLDTRVSGGPIDWAVFRTSSRWGSTAIRVQVGVSALFPRDKLVKVGVLKQSDVAGGGGWQCAEPLSVWTEPHVVEEVIGWLGMVRQAPSTGRVTWRWVSGKKDCFPGRIEREDGVSLVDALHALLLTSEDKELRHGVIHSRRSMSWEALEIEFPAPYGATIWLYATRGKRIPAECVWVGALPTALPKGWPGEEAYSLNVYALPEWADLAKGWIRKLVGSVEVSDGR